MVTLLLSSILFVLMLMVLCILYPQGVRGAIAWFIASRILNYIPISMVFGSFVIIALNEMGVISV